MFALLVNPETVFLGYFGLPEGSLWKENMDRK